MTLLLEAFFFFDGIQQSCFFTFLPFSVTITFLPLSSCYARVHNLYKAEASVFWAYVFLPFFWESWPSSHGFIHHRTVLIILVCHPWLLTCAPMPHCLLSLGHSSTKIDSPSPKEVSFPNLFLNILLPFSQSFGIKALGPSIFFNLLNLSLNPIDISFEMCPQFIPSSLFPLLLL